MQCLPDAVLMFHYQSPTALHLPSFSISFVWFVTSISLIKRNWKVEIRSKQEDKKIPTSFHSLSCFFCATKIMILLEHCAFFFYTWMRVGRCFRCRTERLKFKNFYIKTKKKWTNKNTRRVMIQCKLFRMSLDTFHMCRKIFAVLKRWRFGEFFIKKSFHYSDFALAMKQSSPIVI